MVKTPNYTITEEFHCISPKSQKMVTLEAGSFVRPIHLSYVPEYVLELSQWRDFNSELQTFCHTFYGLIAIPNDIIRET